jgi:hypothetical protein
VFKGESDTLVSESLIAFQAIYRVIEMTEKNLKASYTDTLLYSIFIQSFISGMQDRHG